MTNAEKFVEVFGTDLKRQYATKSWWGQEFVSVGKQEPFMNKSCVAHQVCHEDKVKVLDKIRAEIQATIDEERTGNGNINKGVVIGLQIALDTIDKYKSKSEGQA